MKNNQKIVILWALRIAAFAVAIYGAILFGRTEIFRNMFLQNEFAIMDYETSVFFIILQNLAMMSMWGFVGHYLTKALVKLSIRGIWHNADRNREVKQRNRFRGVVSIIAAVAVICCGVISILRMQTAESWQNTTNTEEPIVDTVVNTTEDLNEEDIAQVNQNTAQEEYEAVMGNNPSSFHYSGGDSMPADVEDWLQENEIIE